VLEETAKERETRLGMRREAWEKKTAEAKGKQGSIRQYIGNRKKLQKVPRKEKLAWQNEEKRGQKGLQKLKVTTKGS
jgi:hypothetical protein